MAGEMIVRFQANLVADPELVAVGERTVCRVRLAHNTRTKRGDEWVDDEPWFIDGTVWPRFASDSWPQNVADSLRKGDTVDVVAKLKREPWESRDGRSGIGYRASVDAIGPSLQRASAKVSKNERGGASAAQGSWGGAPQGMQGWAAPAAAPAAAAAPASNAGFGGFDDEQPF